MIAIIVDWFENHPVTATIVVAAIAVIPVLISLTISAWRYTTDHRASHRQQRFENYHRLIHELVEGRDQKIPRLDSQIAIVFELRNYPEYRELSERLLNGLKASWPENVKTQRLHEEICLTLHKLTRK